MPDSNRLAPPPALTPEQLDNIEITFNISQADGRVFLWAFRYGRDLIGEVRRQAEEIAALEKRLTVLPGDLI
jgi:TolB-like protein